MLMIRICDVMIVQQKERLRQFHESVERKRREYLKTQQVKMLTESLPPLVAKVNNNIEVLGFTPRQRRVFYDSVMRYGLPQDDAYQSQWCVLVSIRNGHVRQNNRYNYIVNIET